MWPIRLWSSRSWAFGMTLVIIAGGIDLSVGSLIALSAVVATSLILATGQEQIGPGRWA